jgi:hypothetical protein
MWISSSGLRCSLPERKHSTERVFILLRRRRPIIPRPVEVEVGEDVVRIPLNIA